MKKPIDIMLDKVDWKPCPEPKEKTGGLYATHTGILNIEGFEFRCAVLNDGQRVFLAEDLEAFIKSMED